MPCGASWYAPLRETTWQGIENNLVIQTLLSPKKQAPLIQTKKPMAIEFNLDKKGEPTRMRAAACKAFGIFINSRRELALPQEMVEQNLIRASHREDSPQIYFCLIDSDFASKLLYSGVIIKDLVQAVSPLIGTRSGCTDHCG